MQFASEGSWPVWLRKEQRRQDWRSLFYRASVYWIFTCAAVKRKRNEKASFPESLILFLTLDILGRISCGQKQTKQSLIESPIFLDQQTHLIRFPQGTQEVGRGLINKTSGEGALRQRCWILSLRALTKLQLGKRGFGGRRSRLNLMIISMTVPTATCP